ncbi:ATP-grasp fold amidoligase family protein, partial [Salinicoccus roseus]
MLRKIIKGLKNPKLFMLYILRFKIFQLIPDDIFLKIKFKLVTGEKLNLKHPKTYNEKLQWLKLHDRKPEYKKLVDKYEVRKYISETIGGEYLIPMIGTWTKFEDIDFDALPNQFVLKVTHDSGGLVICKDKSKLDIEEAKRKINKSLKRNYFYRGREWPYKNLEPRIICEHFLNDEDNIELKDYRFFCFDGKPKFIGVDFNITDKTKTRRNLYDLEWNLLEGQISYPNELSKKIKPPSELSRMINLSKVLSKGIPHVRVDFYNINEKIYFGEMTFYHQSGHGIIQPKELDYLMGEWIS